MGYDGKAIASVLKKFGINFNSFRVETFHSGHINSTYKVDVRHEGKNESFVLQRINTFVFKNPVGLYKQDLIEASPRNGMEISFDIKNFEVTELLTWQD